jgi:hypothetical protein
MLFRIAILGLCALWLNACGNSFCGAPCEKPRPKPAAKRAEEAAPLVNQYGSVYGHLEVDSMAATQLKVEKTSLELLLSENEKDAAILRVLKEGKLDTGRFNYNDYSVGGSRFNASGKLRRDAAVKDSVRQLPRLISESRNRELIERYLQVRRRMAAQEASRALSAWGTDSAAGDATGGDWMKPIPEGTGPAIGDAPAAGTAKAIEPGSAQATGDPPWAGFYRLDADTLIAGPRDLPGLEACEEWGESQAAGHRRKAYAFAFECRRGAERVKRRMW